MTKKKTYCPQCSQKLAHKMEGDVVRDYCPDCQTFFYENPLPVASAIVVHERKILLVKRKNNPYKGKWCLPSGFAETGESIESAALRELKEEAGIEGRIIDFVCAGSSYNRIYGDLIFITFEIEWIEGDLLAGDDAVAVKFFSFDKIPELAFDSNVKAVNRFVFSKSEYWAIIDSFSLSIVGEASKKIQGDYLSNKLLEIVEQNAEIIANRWMNDVRNSKTTPSYALADHEAAFNRVVVFIRQFGKWLGGYFNDKDVSRYYIDLGSQRREEGFKLSEVISAISLTRKYIWEFALSQGMWNKTIDIYMTLELERRMMRFFDKASYYVSKGFEQE